MPYQPRYAGMGQSLTSGFIVWVNVSYSCTVYNIYWVDNKDKMENIVSTCSITWPDIYFDNYYIFVVLKKLPTNLTIFNPYFLLQKSKLLQLSYNHCLWKKDAFSSTLYLKCFFPPNQTPYYKISFTAW